MSEAELILRSDGSAYHLGLLPGQVPPLILTVGDPDRVAAVSHHFDLVEQRVSKREFVSHLGRLAGRPILCLSTGIGTDNVDIALNELDALVNVDLATRRPRAEPRRLTLVRLGTSGALQADLAVDSLLVSSAAVGLDGLGPHYRFAEAPLADALKATYPDWAAAAYGANADGELADALLELGAHAGNTLTCAGFYGPQLRSMRLAHGGPTLPALAVWRGVGQRLDNFEMETAGIYGLAGLLGHRAVSVSVLLANRLTGEFSADPAGAVQNLIARVIGELRRYPARWWGEGR